MGCTGRRWRAAVLSALLVGLLAGPAGAQDSGEPSTTVPDTVPAAPTAAAVPNPEVLGPMPVTNGFRDQILTTPLQPLADHGYQEQELFFGGRAGVHEPVGTWGPDGAWETRSTTTRPYRSRLLVRRPVDPTAFNGTVVVSWVDVSGAFEADEVWDAIGESLMRSGAAYVAVSTQAAGVSGTLGAAAWDTSRYGSLRLVDDALSYDAFSQAGQAVKRPSGIDPLGGLSLDRNVVAVGRGHAAQRLVTYVNAFQPTAQVYDGFLLTDRFPDAAPLGAATVGRSRLTLTGSLNASLPFLPDPRITLRAGVDAADIREDVGVPVLVVLSETDVIEAEGARQADGPLLRTWEVAGSAHLDRTTVASMIGHLRRDFAFAPTDQLHCPSPNSLASDAALRAATRALERWVVDGTAATAAPPLEVDDGEVQRDQLGLARGGLRLPDVEVPTVVHSGASEGAAFCALQGTSTPLTDDELAERYPSHDGYVAAVTAAADAAVTRGHLLPADGEALVTAAAASGIGGADAAPVEAGSGAVADAAPDGPVAPGAPSAANGPADGAVDEESAAADEAVVAQEASKPTGWMATTGWSLLAPLICGLLLLVNGRVVLTIANERRRGGRDADR